MEKLDAFDRKLLARLQVNARETAESLSEAVGLSQAACQRRVKKLRDTGVIAAEVAILDPKAIGGRMTLIVGVTLERGRADIIDAFKREALKEPRIQQCFYTTGDMDFLLVITAHDMADYEALTRTFFFGNPHIQKFTTAVAMEAVKVGFGFPL